MDNILIKIGPETSIGAQFPNVYNENNQKIVDAISDMETNVENIKSVQLTRILPVLQNNETKYQQMKVSYDNLKSKYDELSSKYNEFSQKYDALLNAFNQVDEKIDEIIENDGSGEGGSCDCKDMKNTLEALVTIMSLNDYKVNISYNGNVVQLSEYNKLPGTIEIDKPQSVLKKFDNFIILGDDTSVKSHCSDYDIEYFSDTNNCKVDKRYIFGLNVYRGLQFNKETWKFEETIPFEDTLKMPMDEICDGMQVDLERWFSDVDKSKPLFHPEVIFFDYDKKGFENMLICDSENDCSGKFDNIKKYCKQSIESGYIHTYNYPVAIKSFDLKYDEKDNEIRIPQRAALGLQAALWVDYNNIGDKDVFKDEIAEYHINPYLDVNHKILNIWIDYFGTYPKGTNIRTFKSSVFCSILYSISCNLTNNDVEGQKYLNMLQEHLGSEYKTISLSFEEILYFCENFSYLMFAIKNHWYWTWDEYKKMEEESGGDKDKLKEIIDNFYQKQAVEINNIPLNETLLFFL